MSIFLTAAVVILLTVFIFKYNKKELYKLKRNLEFAISLPGASIFSSFVNSLLIACNYRELLNYVDSTTKKYGNLTRIIIGTNIFIVLKNPEDYKIVLTNVNGNYKTSVTKTSETFLGNGIIRISGPTHKLRRKIIQPLLNLKYLSEYVTLFDTYSNLCVDILEKNVDGTVFDLKPYIVRYSFDISLVTMMGIQGLAHKREYDELLFWQEKLIENAYNRMMKPWLQLDWILPMTGNKKQICIAQKNLLNFFCSITPQKATSYSAVQDNNGIFQKSKHIFNNYWKRVEEVNDNVTNKFCEVSDENFKDDIRNFFMAIQTTIKEVTSFIMIMLAINTEVQEKLRQEISITFNNDNVDAKRLFSMQYFHMVYKETLRLFPISSFILRQLTGDIKLESCTLPDGCYVMIPVFAIHRNPAYWNKPLEFNPERFSSESLSSHHRYAYIPFGTGPRDCLGQRYAFLSVATIIVNLVRRYRFNTSSSMDDVKPTFDVILRIRDVKLAISSV